MPKRIGFKKRWLAWFLLAGVGVTLFWSGKKVFSQAKVEEGPMGALSLQEVNLLKEYHGALVVKFEEGKWYFLGPRGRKWYSLTTSMACRDLKLSCVQTATK